MIGRGLGGGIRRHQVVAAAVGGDGGGLDELAAELRIRHQSLIEHPARDGLEHEEDGAQVDAHHTIPLVRRHLEHGLQADDPGVVEEHVESAPASVGFVDHAVDVLPAGDIRADRGLPQLGGQLLDAGAVEIGEEQLGPVRGEAPGRGRADPARRTRDEHRPTSQLSHRSLSSTLVALPLTLPSPPVGRGTQGISLFDIPLPSGERAG